MGVRVCVCVYVVLLPCVCRLPSSPSVRCSYNSVGITVKSRTTNAQELREEAMKMIDHYGGALIEEFVDGREFSCLVCSNPACVPLSYSAGVLMIAATRFVVCMC